VVGIYGTRGTGQESLQGFGAKGSQKERYHLEDHGIDGRMGSEWT
jgi:hypothetical protein